MVTFADVDELPDPFGAEDENWAEEDDEPLFEAHDEVVSEPTQDKKEAK